jgi:hypothetical protein
MVEVLPLPEQPGTHSFRTSDAAHLATQERRHGIATLFAFNVLYLTASVASDAFDANAGFLSWASLIGTAVFGFMSWKSYCCPSGKSSAAPS